MKLQVSVGALMQPPAVETKYKLSLTTPLRDISLLATEGRATRQRPRLLLGRSVFGPHFNVAIPIFRTSACSGTLVFAFNLILFVLHSRWHLFPAPVPNFPPPRLI